MNTQELKQYIDRVLGNKIRCLLPSFWWKKIFREVVDRVDEVEQSTSKLIESKVEEVKMPIVESVDEMENLKLAKGRVAAVEKVGESETVKISDCYVSLNWEEDWDKYTIVKGVEEKDVILDKDVTAYVIFSASKETIIKDALQVIVESGRFYYMKWTDDEPSVTSLEEVNKALYSGKYRAIHYSNAPDDYFTFYLAKPQPSLYIKGDSWEMLTKENVVNSENELNGLSVPYGSIAKVNSKQYGKINPFNCYRITSQPSNDTVKRNWDKLKRITQIDVINPDAEPSTMPTIILHGYANFGRDLIQIGYYQGYKVGTGNSSSATFMSLDEMNSLLKNSDYRLLMISDTAEHREFFDKCVSLYSPDFIVPNAYIKGDSWTRLLKEGDLGGNEGDNMVIIYANEESTRNTNAFNTIIDCYENEKPYVAVVKIDEMLYSANITIQKVNDRYGITAQCINTSYNKFYGVLLGLSVETGVGLANLLTESELINIDSVLSDTSENAVQNKVVTTAINNKVDKVSGKQLSTEDFTTALKTKLEGLSNYDDTSIQNAVNSLTTQINTLVSGDASAAIESFNEIIAFLNGVEDSESLDSIIAAIEQQIAGKQDKLVSGTNIKTINGESILGEGNIVVNVDTSNLATKEELNNAIATSITNILNMEV